MQSVMGGFQQVRSPRKRSGCHGVALFSTRSIFGMDLPAKPRFACAVRDALKQVLEDRVAGLVQATVSTIGIAVVG